MTSWRRQAGLTLVELMIATTLSIVLLAGVLLVFSANKATYQMQNGLGTLQENGRYAISQIASDLQMAGFGGCLSPHFKRLEDSVVRVVNVVSSSPPYLTEFIDGTFLVGRDNQSTTVTMGGVNMVPGTDSIEIRGPLRSNVNFVTGAIPADQPVVILGDATGFAANEYLLIGDCSSATLFRATAVSTSGGNTTITHTTSNNSQNELGQPYGGDAVVMEFATHTYFIGTTGRNNTSGQAITALYRFDGTNSTELVDGVENLQIAYAMDADGDRDIDQFTPAGAGVNLADAVAVRISLLLNSVDAASAVEAPYTYFPSSSTAITPTTGDLRLRQEFSSVISIRNSVL